MGIFKKVLHSKSDIFVKFESAINLEIQGQIEKKIDSFYLGHRDRMYAFFYQNLGRSRLGHWVI